MKIKVTGQTFDLPEGLESTKKKYEALAHAVAGTGNYPKLTDIFFNDLSWAKKIVEMGQTSENTNFDLASSAIANNTYEPLEIILDERKPTVGTNINNGHICFYGDVSKINSTSKGNGIIQVNGNVDEIHMDSGAVYVNGNVGKISQPRQGILVVSGEIESVEYSRHKLNNDISPFVFSRSSQALFQGKLKNEVDRKYIHQRPIQNLENWNINMVRKNLLDLQKMEIYSQLDDIRSQISDIETLKNLGDAYQEIKYLLSGFKPDYNSGDYDIIREEL